MDGVRKEGHLEGDAERDDGHDDGDAVGETIEEKMSTVCASALEAIRDMGW